MLTSLPIHHLSFPNQYLITSTMLRFEEHYESPRFRGLIFTLEEFMDWYAAERGAFSYFTDWRGFNLPSRVLQPFRAGAFDPLTRKERAVLDLTAGLPEPFYLIASVAGMDDVEMHEIVHGLFSTVPDYAAAVRDTLGRHDTVPLRTALTALGYHPEVHDDETNAYVLTGLSKKMPPLDVTDLKRDLKAAFTRSFGLDIDDAEVQRQLTGMVNRLTFNW